MVKRVKFQIQRHICHTSNILFDLINTLVDLIDTDLDANENNKSVGPNKAKHNIRRCPMERYGMCPDIGYDDIAVESQNKLAERKSKCIKMLINVSCDFLQSCL